MAGCAMDSKMINPPLTMLAIASVITRGRHAEQLP